MVFLTLLVQNSLVLLCSVALAVAFSLEVSACNELLPFALTVVVVIILGSSANLATVANTIAVERDWVVVIADKNESALAGGPLLLYLRAYRAIKLFNVNVKDGVHVLPFCPTCSTERKHEAY